MGAASVTDRSLPNLAGQLRSAPASWAFMAAGAVAIGIYFLLPSDAQSIFYVCIGFASVTAIYLRARRCLPAGERLPWQLCALGLRGQVAGDAIFAVYEVGLNEEPPSPSVADAFYLGGYPLLALRIVLVLRRLGGQTRRAAILDSLVIFCGVVLFQWVFFIEPYRHMAFANSGARLVTMA